MKLTYRRIGVVLSLVVAISFVLTYVATGTPQHLAEARFDGWGYTIVADPDGFTRAQIEYDRATVEDLRKYVATNQSLARQLAADGYTELLVTISFRRPLSVDEFRSWAARMPLRVTDYQLRIIGTDGQRWTLGGSPSNGELVSDSDLQRNLAHLSDKGATDLRGVIVVEGQVDASAYTKLAADPDVFLADVTRTATAAHVKNNVGGIDHTRLALLVAPAFSWMEDLGLENFQ